VTVSWFTASITSVFTLALVIKLTVASADAIIEKFFYQIYTTPFKERWLPANCAEPLQILYCRPKLEVAQKLAL